MPSDVGYVGSHGGHLLFQVDRGDDGSAVVLVTGNDPSDRRTRAVTVRLDAARWDRLKELIAAAGAALRTPARRRETEIGSVAGTGNSIDVRFTRTLMRSEPRVTIQATEWSGTWIITHGPELDESGFKALEDLVARTDSMLGAAGGPAPSLQRQVAGFATGLEEALRASVKGQDEAVRAVAQVIRVAKAGFARPGGPLGVLLFIGPTGVGKTELAKAIAKEFFHSEHNLHRFDMSAYHNMDTVNRLIGMSPGYEGSELGGELTNRLQERPEAVLLLDEIDKAYPPLIDLFLPVFDEGMLRDGRGRETSFRKTIIVLTANFLWERGATRGPKAAVDAEGGQTAVTQDDLRKELCNHMRPELVNRIDRVIQFEPLGLGAQKEIVRSRLKEVQERVAARRFTLSVGEGTEDVLLKLGYSVEFGARALQRVIEEHVVQQLAEGWCDGRFPDGSKVSIDPTGDSVSLTVVP